MNSENKTLKNTFLRYLTAPVIASTLALSGCGDSTPDEVFDPNTVSPPVNQEDYQTKKDPFEVDDKTVEEANPTDGLAPNTSQDVAGVDSEPTKDVPNVPNPVKVAPEIAELRKEKDKLEQTLEQNRKENNERQSRIFTLESRLEQVVPENDKLREENDKLEQRVPAQPRSEPTDTHNLRGTYGFNPNFIEMGIGGSRTMVGKYAQTRVVKSIIDLLDSPLILEAQAKVQDGKFYNQKLEMPLGVSGETALLFDIGKGLENLLKTSFDKKTILAGIFAEGNHADFNGYLNNQWTMEGGILTRFQGEKSQGKFKAGYIHQETKFDELREVLDGAFAEVSGAAYLGKGLTLFFNGGAQYAEGSNASSSSMFKANCKELKLETGTGLAWNVKPWLTLTAQLDAMFARKKYDGREGTEGVHFPTDRSSAVEGSIGVIVRPLASGYNVGVYGVTEKKTDLLGNFYLAADFSAYKNSAQKTEATASVKAGFKF